MRDLLSFRDVFFLVLLSVLAVYALGLLLGGVVMAVLLSRPIVESFQRLKARADESAVSEWQGRYYSWGGRHIRIYEQLGHVWVVDEDLIFAAGLKFEPGMRRKLEISYAGSYARIPNTKFYGFTETGVSRFLSGKQERSHDVIRLKLWFENEVFHALQNKRKSYAEVGEA